MKHIWTENDIISGRYVCKPPANKPMTKKDFTELAMTTWKLGYNGGAAAMLMVAMTDGAIVSPSSKEQMANHLNDDGYIPMPHKWLMGVMDAMRDWYEGV